MGVKRKVSNSKKSNYKCKDDIPNLREESLNDNLNDEIMYRNDLKQQKNKSSMHYDLTRINKECFKRNMTQKRVSFELFFLESDDLFESKSLKSRMADVAKRSSKELQSWFYDRVVENELPQTWEEFKTEIILYCTDS
jgi:hypothetical protein